MAVLLSLCLEQGLNFNYPSTIAANSCATRVHPKCVYSPDSYDHVCSCGGGGAWCSATPGVGCVREEETGEGEATQEDAESDEALVEKKLEGLRETVNNEMEEKTLDVVKKTKVERKSHNTKKHKKKTVLVRKIK